MAATTAAQGLVARWRDCLPLPDDAPVVSLGEGATPLLRVRHIEKLAATPLRLYVKYEGLNPTGSFKDRGMTVAVSHALTEGRGAVICASTGNTSAAAAAYAARAGMRAFVVIPEGKIASGKLAQALIEGATVIQIRGNFDQGLELIKSVADEAGLAIVNSINPYRLQGQKTAALEIIETLGDAPDYHCIPVGNAGNITAYWMGYSEAAGRPGMCTEDARKRLGAAVYREAPHSATRLPRMHGYQASGAAPIVRGQKVENPETVATAIRIGNPQSWQQALAARDESGGRIDECTDEEILEAQRLLASREGVFCEPASAISIAGLLKDARAGCIEKGATVVCTLTGHGLKDPETAVQQSAKPPAVIDADLEAVRRVLREAG